jgi:alanine-synthesizing transaminase
MVFAKRTDWDLSENPLSLELTQLRAGGGAFCDLTESNPTRAGIAYPAEGLLALLADPANLVYAPASRGLLKAREAVAGYYAGKQASVDAGQIILTASSSEAYAFLFRLLADPHDRVLLPAPSYPLFSYLAGINDVATAYYQIFFDGKAWRIDWDSLEEALSRDTKAVIVVSPNNPTGSCLKPDELKRLNTLCAASGAAIISDEVFADYMFAGQEHCFQTLAANSKALSFALGGLSKAMALPQMKLAWIAVNGPKKQVQDALARLEVIADTYLSVNTPVQNALPSWLAGRGAIRDQVMARVQANYDHLRAVTPATPAGVTVYPVEGGWYAVVKIAMDIPEDEWAVRLLKERRVFVHPGYFFDFNEEGIIVLSLLTPVDVFQEGVKRIFERA